MRKKADLWRQAFDWFSNRYVLTAAVGLVWVTFISEIDLVYLAKSQLELNRLENQVAHYELEIETTRNQLVDLTSNPERLEPHLLERCFEDMSLEHPMTHRHIQSRRRHGIGDHLVIPRSHQHCPP